ncbi:MAG: hypothetical protein C4540_04745 [Candidatus Omnitrophota bacterium]|jgi:exonuclease SbcC|nr:MAG: hypothetical protein C4540_04745 [Candidatus Omnitrophota bacterium]
MIKRLVIKDCLGIEELAINPGKVNVISGGNERGKTSILETIEKALYNTKRRARFVRTGADKAYIELETDDGISIRRTVKEDEAGLDEGSVKVTKAGVPVKSPETFLKELFGYQVNKGTHRDVFVFNPVDFMQKKDTEQTSILFSLMPIMVTAKQALEWFGEAPKVNYENHGLQVLKALEEWFYDARREANARVKATEDESAAVAKRLPDNYEVEAWEQINLGALFAELNDAQETNRDIVECHNVIEAFPLDVEAIRNKYALQEKEAQENEKTEYEQAKEAIEGDKKDLIVQIDMVDEEIKLLQDRIQKLINEKESLRVKVKALDEISLAERKAALVKVTKERLKTIAERKKEELTRLEVKKKQAEFFLDVHQLIDTAPIKNRCIEAERMKSFIPLAREVGALQDRLKEEEATAEHYDKCVETARLKPHELLATVELPIKDLGVDGRGIVTIKDLPLSNLSTAQQVRICLDIARVLAKDNPLKLICVDKLEHLDETVRAEFLQQIEGDQEFQFFITVVTDGDLQVETK